MKAALLVCIAATLTIAMSASAQEASTEDEVIAYGTKQNDPAMSAFLAGDYETAEIEFDKNAFCALRIERNFIAGLESARTESIRADVAGDAAATAQPTGGVGGGGTVPTAQSPTATTTVNSSNLKKKKENKRRTCEDRGYQVYMKGMSQLQLGKRAETQKTLTKATKIKRTLFDAHFRLGLMAYQDGELEKAQKQLKALERIAKRCKSCNAKDEIQTQLSYLSNLLE